VCVCVQVIFPTIFSLSPSASGVYIVEGGAIMPATLTGDSDTLVLVLATLDGVT
jgi:hypothetical protein